MVAGYQPGCSFWRLRTGGTPRILVMNLDQWDWLPRPIFFVVASGVAVWMVLARLGEGKGHVAELLSPLSRRMRERVARRAAAEKERESADKERRKEELREALKEEDAPGYLAKAQQRQIEALDASVKRLEKKVIKLESDNAEHAENRDMTGAYLQYDATYHLEAAVEAAEQGFRLPKHKSYTVYCQEYRAARGQPTGRRWNDPEEQ